MRCLNESLVQQYIDSELDAQISNKVEKHLSVCPSCTSKVRMQRKFSDAFKKTINHSTNESVKLPDFKQKEIRKTYSVKMLIWELSAACMLVFLIYTEQSKKSASKNIPLSGSYIEFEIDANKPITNQSTIIILMDENGNIKQYIN